MASPVSASTFCCSSYLKSSRTTTLDYSIPSSSCSQLYQCTSRFSLSMLSSQLSRSQLSTWNGLKQLGTSISKKQLVIGKKRRCKGKVVHASLFGVGAPEALVIGVVALLVFGPKGLAEVARNLGKTLRAFQPTIRELQEVSREFKSSLEREIGLDEIPNSSQSSYRSSRPNSVSTSAFSSNENSQAVSEPNGPSASRAYSSEEFLKMTEEQLQAAASLQTDASSSEEQNPIEANTLPQGIPLSILLMFLFLLQSTVVTVCMPSAAQEKARETPSGPQSPENKA